MQCGPPSHAPANMMGHGLKPWAKINLFSLQLFRPGCFITATRGVTIWVGSTLASRRDHHGTGLMESQHRAGETCGFMKPLPRIGWTGIPAQLNEPTASENKEVLSLFFYSHWPELGEIKLSPHSVLNQLLNTSPWVYFISRLKYNWFFFSGLGIRPGPLHIWRKYFITELCPQFLRYNIHLVVFTSRPCHVRHTDDHICALP